MSAPTYAVGALANSNSTLQLGGACVSSVSMNGLTVDSSGNISTTGTISATNMGNVLRNRLVNGDMRLDQRYAGSAPVCLGNTTASAAASAYGADRWQAATGAASGLLAAQQVALSAADKAAIGNVSTKAVAIAPAVAPSLTTGLTTLLTFEGSNAVDTLGGITGPTWTGTPAYTTGKIGSTALNLSANPTTGSATTYVTYNTPTISVPLTISFWMYATAPTAGVQNMCVLYNGANGGYNMYIYNSGQLAIDSYVGNASVNIGNIAATAIPANTWVHMCGTLQSGGYSSMYINGVLVTQSAVASGSLTVQTSGSSVNTIGLGYRQSGVSGTSYPFQGYLDDFRIYNRALTPAEITTLYNYNGTTIPMQVSSSLLSGLVAYVPFEGGSVQDVMGFLTAPTWTGTPAYTTGKVGSTALNLSANTATGGTTTYATNYVSLNCALTSTTFSVAFWVNITTLPGTNYSTIMSFITSTYTPFDVMITSGRLYCDFLPTNVTNYNTSTDAGAAISANTWMHICVSVTSGSASGHNLYVNGVLYQSASTVGASSTMTPTSIRFGGRWDASSAFSGYIDDFRLYNRVLTAAEIGLLAANTPALPIPNSLAIPQAPSTTGLVSYYPFEPAAAPTNGLISYIPFNNSSANDLIGTTFGSPTVYGSAYSSSIVNIGTTSLDLSGNTAGATNPANYVTYSSTSLSAVAAFSVSFWMYVVALPSNLGTIVNLGSWGSNSAFYDVIMNSSGNIYSDVQVNSSTNLNTGFAGSVPTGKWVHMCGTVAMNTTGGNILYMNGNVLASANTNGSQTININGLWIGRRSDGSFGFKGYITEFRLYNRALSPNEVAQLAGSLYDYQGIQSITTSGLTTQLTFDSTTADAQGALSAPTAIGLPYYVNTFAGSGASGFTNATGTSATFADIIGIAIDNNQSIYLTDLGNQAIRKITSSGVVTTLSTGYNNPQGIRFDGMNTLYICDVNNNVIKKLTLQGTVSTWSSGWDYCHFIAIDKVNGYIYGNEYLQHAIYRIASDGTRTIFAGTSGTSGSTNGTGTSAKFSNPSGMVCDASGNLYVCDFANNLIRKITVGGVVTTFAGSGAATSIDGTGTAATFNNPGSIEIDAQGNLYVGEYGGNKLRKITPAGVVTTIVGSGVSTFADGAGVSAQLSICDLVIDVNSNFFVCDRSNKRVRRISSGYSVINKKVGTASLDVITNPACGAALSKLVYAVTPTLPITVACWFYATDVSTAGQQSIYSFGVNGDGASYALDLTINNSSSGQLYQDIYVGTVGSTATNVSVTTTSNIVANTWYHAVTTISNTTQQVLTYVNGILVGSSSSVPASGTLVGSNKTAVTSLIIGANVTTNNSFKGYVDDFRIYNRVLSSTEIAALASYANPLTSTGTMQYVGGRVGTQALYLANEANVIATATHASNYVTIPYNLTSATITVSTWVYCTKFPPNTNYSSYIYEFGSSSTEYFAVYINSLGIGGYVGASFMRSPLALNTWCHVVVKYVSGGSSSIYINGILINTVTASAGASCTLQIGDSPLTSVNNPFAGYIDDFRIYNRALSASEIAGLFYAGQSSAYALYQQPIEGQTIADIALGTSAAAPLAVSAWLKNNTANAQSFSLALNGANPGLTTWIPFENGSAADVMSGVTGPIITGTSPLSSSTYKIGSGSFNATANTSPGGSGSIIYSGLSYTPSSPNILALPLTISVWTYCTVASTLGCGILSFGNSANGNDGLALSIICQGSDRYYADINVAGTRYNSDTASGTVFTNQWVHLCVTIAAGGSIILYMNGSPSSTTSAVPSNAVITAVAGTVAQMTLGSLATNRNTFRGYIDDVRIYNTALSGAQVLQLYQNNASSSALSSYLLPRSVIYQTPSIPAASWQKLSFALPGDLLGTYPTDNSRALTLALCLGAGANVSSSTSNVWQNALVYNAANTQIFGASSNNFLASPYNSVLLTGVQLEEGAASTSFEILPLQTVLPLAQRYFEKSYSQTDALGNTTQNGALSWSRLAANRPSYSVPYKTPKRTVPTVTLYNPITGMNNSIRNIDQSANGPATLERSGDSGFGVYWPSTNTGQTLGDAIAAHYSADAEL